MRFTFGDCVLDLDTREVFRGGRSVALSPKAFALLDLLMRNGVKRLTAERILEIHCGGEADANAGRARSHATSRASSLR